MVDLELSAICSLKVRQSRVVCGNERQNFFRTSSVLICKADLRSVNLTSEVIFSMRL